MKGEIRIRMSEKGLRIGDMTSCECAIHRNMKSSIRENEDERVKRIIRNIIREDTLEEVKL